MSCCGKGDWKEGKRSEGCVCEVVRAIKDIQDNSIEEECRPCLTSCFLEPLGDLVSPSRRNKADTRVFILKTKDGTPFHAFYRDGDLFDTDCISIFFRVEEVFDHCCATLRVLEPRNKAGQEVNLLTDCGTKIKLSALCEVYRFDATDSCITVDLNCFCAIQCIKDVYLGLCD